MIYPTIKQYNNQIAALTTQFEQLLNSGINTVEKREAALKLAKSIEEQMDLQKRDFNRYAINNIPGLWNVEQMEKQNAQTDNQ